MLNGKMTAQAHIFFDDKQCLVMQGALTVDTVSDLLKKTIALFDTHLPSIVDMQQVDKVDSAGLVMLIHMIRIAQIQTQNIRFVHAPEMLCDLIQLSGLEKQISHYFADLDVGNTFT